MGTIMSLPWSAVWGLEITEVQDWAGAALGKQQKLSHLTVVTPLPSHPPAQPGASLWPTSQGGGAPAHSRCGCWFAQWINDSCGGTVCQHPRRGSGVSLLLSVRRVLLPRGTVSVMTIPRCFQRKSSCTLLQFRKHGSAEPCSGVPSLLWEI